MDSLKLWFRKGEPWVWLNAGAVAISVVMVVGLLGLVAVRGLSHFWPHTIIEGVYTEPDGSSYTIIGEVADEEWVAASRVRGTGVAIPEEVKVVKRMLIKTGNRDITGLDFRWLIAENLQDVTTPEQLMVVERREWGNFYGYLVAVKENGRVVASGESALAELEARLERALDLTEEIHEIENAEIGAINYQLERLRLKQRRLELDDALTDAARLELQEERAALDAQYQGLKSHLDELNVQIGRDSMVARSMNGAEKEIPLKLVVQFKQPNAMSFFGKVADYFHQLWLFLSDDPREANTEGGVFPAIFGTVLMVILMSVIVTPFGVVAAVYLREYAKQGPLTRTIRVAVNNLAGVPSIVYGVFGLGFFVYFLGGNLDALFYPEAAPAPVFGTPGLMWASITLALLTLPVVIVATEEGLTRIPKSLREGSLALGATKFETITKVILPMSSPAMMTGLILAIARAAGEVAPLMLVGVVKLAPTLPLDGNFPYLHLERKFMHLGFHIYDVGFQSPNVEAARPLVYATAALLVVVIVALNLTAIMIRNRLREKYRALEN
ncbi:MAG: phosphate ABC transporter, permease protein PstA [Pseudomonadales bacterium]|nr:phosphate ABC transporter, permease protein PstA [Pseudomonadales bacterium]MCK5791637.1 phosphate ABC transporter permease PstA [Ketobacter sp.]HAG93303.1 phosphate ABC transporter permease PtsA [Gammaproteobacteria bacterium]HAU16279.1 phosphate ABC transporter permease PtsA [Gammaproteobacteria bacterium]HBO95009.1 phosphate ABC transporter permease PtsA [Gammaproteobacteria bacterium]|tara:strand:- start:5543 stop:7204 length:1662 start_codon:yes stop_codon:yes gene_type:complete